MVRASLAFSEPRNLQATMRALLPRKSRCSPCIVTRPHGLPSAPNPAPLLQCRSKAQPVDDMAGTFPGHVSLIDIEDRLPLAGPTEMIVA